MAGKHRKVGRKPKGRITRTSRKAVAIGAVTATATALAVGAPPEPIVATAAPKYVNGNVDMMAAFNPWPRPDQITDITGGMGSGAYNAGQTMTEQLIRALVDHISLTALAQASGLDLPSLIENALSEPDQLLSAVLEGVLGQIPIDLGPVLEPVLGGTATSLLLDALGELLPDTGGVTDLLSLLNLVGLDLSDPLNLSNIDVPGLNVITTGPIFTMLKLLGVDLGWVPALPNAVATAVNGGDYLQVGVVGLLEEVLDRLGQLPVDPVDPLDPLNPLDPLLDPLDPLLDHLLDPVLGPLITGLRDAITNLPVDIPDALSLRVEVVTGVGLGAFAAATAYDKIVADLANQPGGLDYAGTDPLLGSITVLPMLLLFNPARPNGGMLSRLYPFFGSLGVNTVNPDTEVTSNGALPELPTGIRPGGANLVPILVDVSVEYHPTSDFAAWPNPVSLANNLMAGLFPTYMLRGLTLDGLAGQLTDQITAAVEKSTLEGTPLALNLYATIPSATLPLLEPLYLLSDAISLLSGGTQPVNFFTKLANALAPALKSLTNIGYTDAYYDPATGGYERRLDDAGTPTGFLSFPSLDWGQVIGVVLTQLFNGFYKEFVSGNPTPGTPNALGSLFNFLSGGSLLAPQANTLAAPNELPDANARMLSLGTDDPQPDVNEFEALTAQDEVVDEIVEEGVIEEGVIEEAIVEEAIVDEEIVDELTDEEVIDEEALDDEVTDEEVVDEEVTDEEDADEEDADGENADDGNTTSPSTQSTATPGNLSSPTTNTGDDDKDTTDNTSDTNSDPGTGGDPA